jgi:hypothetical protein
MYRPAFYNPTPRNLKWYLKEYKEFNTLKEEEVNWNANTYKWFTAFAIALMNHRVNINTLNPNLPTNDKLNKLFFKHLGFQIVAVYVTSIGRTLFIPISLTSAYRSKQSFDSPNLTFILKSQFEYQKQTKQIMWCPRTKDWWTRGSFIVYYTTNELGEKITESSAINNVFNCSICQNWFEKKSPITTIHKLLATLVCKWCAALPVENKPHTLSSIYGEYHSHGRSWTFFPVYYQKDTSIPIGVELEIQYKGETRLFDPIKEAWNIYQKQLEINPEWNYFYTERDGSIGGSGLEIITQPMSRRMHHVYWKAMLPIIRENFVGWNTEEKTRETQFGIHLTFDINKFGHFNLIRLMKFIENTGNKEFSQALAQRGRLYGTDETIAGTDKKVRNIVQFNNNKMYESYTRKQIFNVKSHGQLCEVRMFRSTLNRTSFMKNLQFLYAFHEWCLNTSYNVDHKAFIDWLLKNGRLYLKYSSLYKYFAHQVFPVKFPMWNTNNPWKEAFDKVILYNQKGQKDLFQTSFTPDDTDYKKSCA